MWLQTHTIDFSGVAQPASSSEKAGTDSNQSSYKATGDSSERFWWGDHRRINDFAGYCCDLHQIMAGYAVTDKSNALSHRKPDWPRVTLVRMVICQNLIGTNSRFLTCVTARN